MPITVGGTSAIPYVASSAPNLQGLDSMIQAGMMRNYAMAQREEHFRAAYAQRAQFQQSRMNDLDQRLQTRIQAKTAELNQRQQMFQQNFTFKQTAQQQQAMQMAQHKYDSMKNEISANLNAMNDPTASFQYINTLQQRNEELHNQMQKQAQVLGDAAGQAMPVPKPPVFDTGKFITENFIHAERLPDGTIGPTMGGPLPPGTHGMEAPLMHRAGAVTAGKWQDKNADPEAVQKMRIAQAAQAHADQMEANTYKAEMENKRATITATMHNDAIAQANWEKRVSARAKEIRSLNPNMSEPDSRDQAAGEIGNKPPSTTFSPLPTFAQWRQNNQQQQAQAAQQQPSDAQPAGQPPPAGPQAPAPMGPPASLAPQPPSAGPPIGALDAAGELGGPTPAVPSQVPVPPNPTMNAPSPLEPAPAAVPTAGATMGVSPPAATPAPPPGDGSSSDKPAPLPPNPADLSDGLWYDTPQGPQKLLGSHFHTKQELPNDAS